ncbi:hypothetical protein [Wenzhouxiangella sp. EGI_FJ10409]|uniref:hypothetical protein n=1 Tax=Wenzhouxiangella sp. EGI_FJ10409 TaxID=3243767 RepID=UPI0035E13C91
MCKRRHIAVVWTMALSAAWAAHLNASDAIAPAIECEARPGYHLCQARSEAEEDELQHEWSVSGDLALNLASGPMASVRCEEGQSGLLRLRTRGPSWQARVCVAIECGEEEILDCPG